MKEGNGKSLSKKESAAFKKMMAQQEEFLRKYGWYIHFVYEDCHSPTHVNIHTHGLSQSWNHADLQIVLPLEPTRAFGVFSEAVNLIKKGFRFEPGKEYDNVLGGGFKILFAWAREGMRWILRMILPDPDGHLLPEGMRQGYAEQWEGTRKQEAP